MGEAFHSIPAGAVFQKGRHSVNFTEGTCVIFHEMITLLQNTNTLKMPNYVSWSCLVVKGTGQNRNL